MTRGVPCLRRATALAYTDADEDAERLLSFGELSATGNEEDEWVETHTGRPSSHEAAGNAGDLQEIPDVDEQLSSAMGGASLSSNTAEDHEAIPDIDDIPDMEEEDLEGEDDAAVVAPKPSAVIDARCVVYFSDRRSYLFCFSQVEVAKGNLLQVRTYDVLITYDKYYQTPRLWLIGYDEVSILQPSFARR